MGYPAVSIFSTLSSLPVQSRWEKDGWGAGAIQVMQSLGTGSWWEMLKVSLPAKDYPWKSLLDMLVPHSLSIR